MIISVVIVLAVVFIGYLLYDFGKMTGCDQARSEKPIVNYRLYRVAEALYPALAERHGDSPAGLRDAAHQAYQRAEALVAYKQERDVQVR